jgi:integrase
MKARTTSSGTKKAQAGQRGNIVKRGNSWYVRFVRDGKVVRRSAGRSKEAAQELLGKLLNDADRVAAGLPAKPTSAPTLREWKSDYMKAAKARKAKRSWERDDWCYDQLCERFGALRLTEITRARVEAFMHNRREEVTPATVNRQVALLRRVLNYAVEMGRLDANPMRGIKLYPEAPARLPTLDATDEAKILNSGPQWLRWIVRLALYTGCRQGELLALRWRHVDLASGALIVEDSKSGESRRVFLSAALAEELRRRRGLPDGFVVSMANGKLPKGLSVSQAFRRVVRKIGRPDLRFHDLRHVAGSRLLDAGASLPDVATVLGHKTLVIARRYAHSSPTRLRDLMQRMPGADGAGSDGE